MLSLRNLQHLKSEGTNVTKNKNNSYASKNNLQNNVFMYFYFCRVHSRIEITCKTVVYIATFFKDSEV